jgi:anti-sigma factor RsiW
MNEHVTKHLSSYMDDELSATARTAVDAHLRDCRDCSADLEALRQVVAHAAAIAAHDAPPARDLWTGIQARIDGSSVAAFRPRTENQNLEPGTRNLEARRISLSVAQLAMAAALLMAVSGTAAWMLRGRAPVAGVTGQAIIQAEIEPRASSTDVRPVNFADPQYDAAVSDLERALEERRNDLNPRTVEILERNLKLIDAAIAQARQALEEDPGNMYLNRHLVDSRRRKLDLLRRATSITEGD